MEVVARPPFDGTWRYLARAFRPKLDWVRSIPGHPPLAEDIDGPTVVLITDEGREIVLQRPGTLGQARRARPASSKSSTESAQPSSVAVTAYLCPNDGRWISTGGSGRRGVLYRRSELQPHGVGAVVIESNYEPEAPVQVNGRISGVDAQRQTLEAALSTDLDEGSQQL